MSILCSRVSLDDYQLKIRNLLRNSEFRDIITKLPKGSFVFPESDMMLTTQPFKQNGKPSQIKPIPQAKLQQTEKKQNIIQKIAYGLNSVLFPSANVPQRATANRNLSTQNTEEELNRLDRENEENDLREIEEEFPEEW